MKLTNLQNIGTNFQKENVVLATIVGLRDKQKKDLEARMKEVEGDENIKKDILDIFLNSAITYEEVDIFYKGENCYTRFVEEGPETFVGDDSDGKGFIRNVIPVWDYYSEDELKEVLVNDIFISIVATTMEPLKKYNDDYNK